VTAGLELPGGCFYIDKKNRSHERSGQVYYAPIRCYKAISCTLLFLRRSGFLGAWRLNYLPGLQARGADFNTFRNSVYQSPNSLQVRVPPPFSQVMGVGNIMSKVWFLAANLAYFCHIKSRFFLSSPLSPIRNLYLFISEKATNI
jgi:hypothetical protein